MEKKDKKPMAPILKAMKLYDSEEYSLDNYTSVSAAISAIQTEKQGIKFTRKRNNETRTFRVTRTA